jgi:hypothetical protein
MKLLVGAGLALFSLSASAQKYDRENLEFNNVHIPSKLIYDQVKTYAYNISMHGGDPSGLSSNDVNNLLYSFKSFDKAEYSNADMKINYSVGPFSYVGEKTISRTTEEEVNKVKVKVTKYKRVYEFRYPVRVELLNSKNNVRLYVNEYASGNVRSIEGYEYNSESEAVNSFERTRSEAVKANIVSHVSDFVKGVNGATADQYDFYPVNTVLDIMQFKKWDRDDEYNKYVSHVKQVMKNMTAGEPVELYKEKLNEDIKYFQQFEGVFKPKDKKEDILYFGNYMNLATIFFCVDDLEKAEYYIAKLDSVDKKEGMTNILKGYIKSARNRMSKHHLTTTHIDYNPVKDYRLAGKTITSDALSSAENMVMGLGEEGLAKANDVVKFANGTTSKGKVIFYAESNTLKLLTADKPNDPVILNPNNTISFNIDSVEYLAAKHKYTGPVEKQFFIVKFKSEKIVLLSLLTPTLTEVKAFGTLRPNEELVNMIGGFGVKKDLAKYFEDCTIVSAKAKDGDYVSSMTTDIKKFILMCEEYTKECGTKTAGTN